MEIRLDGWEDDDGTFHPFLEIDGDLIDLGPVEDADPADAWKAGAPRQDAPGGVAPEEPDVRPPDARGAPPAPPDAPRSTS